MTVAMSQPQSQSQDRAQAESLAALNGTASVTVLVTVTVTGLRTDAEPLYALNGTAFGMLHHSIHPGSAHSPFSSQSQPSQKSGGPRIRGRTKGRNARSRACEHDVSYPKTG